MGMASAKTFMAFAGAAMFAHKAFVQAQKIIHFLATVGVKSYDEDYKMDDLFKSGAPMHLKVGKRHCLGVRDGSLVSNAPCDEHAIWRADRRQADKKSIGSGLVLQDQWTTSSHALQLRGWKDAGSSLGIAGGTCLVRDHPHRAVSSASAQPCG